MSLSWDAQLAHVLGASLDQGRVLWPVLVVFVGGLLTACTPCVYPLVPITVRYFVMAQKRDGASVVHTAPLVVAYALGMVGLYAGLGTLFASTHQVMGRALAHPLVLLGMSFFCALMALSMLGFLTVQLPSALSTRLSRVGHASVPGAFAMGLVSGLIAAPCTGPVSAVILTVIASKGAVLLGFYLMCAFGLGVALPFLVLAWSFARFSRVPAAGPWMDGVKVLLSAAMFAVAWMFFCQVYPDARRMPWWALLVTGALMLGVVFVKRLRVRWMPLLWAVLGAQCVGWLLFAQPLSGHEGPSAPLVWRVKHDEAVVFARAQKKPMMIDFTAQWCQACQELEHRTFTDEAVRKEGVRFVALKVDATTMDDAVEALFQKYGVLGLPAVVFVDSSGNVLEKPRVTGFVSAEEYVLMMRDVQ